MEDKEERKYRMKERHEGKGRKQGDGSDRKGRLIIKTEGK